MLLPENWTPRGSGRDAPHLMTSLLLSPTVASFLRHFHLLSTEERGSEGEKTAPSHRRSGGEGARRALGLLAGE